MRFMRYHATKTAKPKAEEQKKDKAPTYQSLLKGPVKLVSKAEMRKIGNKLAQSLKDWQEGRGHPPKEGKSTLADANLRWCLLFMFTDKDGNRRIDFEEFRKAVMNALRPKDLTVDEL